MKFSIITVCRNSERVLHKAMESLSAQHYKDYEWVVIDGASTDGTLKIVQSFSSAPLLVVSEPDHGIYDAMNKGVAKARGDYVFFLNSDDALYDEKVLQDVSDWLDRNPAVDLVYGSVVNVRADGDWLRDFGHVDKYNIIEDGICHQAIFARRLLFTDVGLFDPRFKLNADYDWIIRVFRSGGCCTYINRRLAFFSDGGAHSLDRSYLAKERESVRRQYIGRHWLIMRLLRARILNRLHRIISGHAPGTLRMTARHPR